jgi:mRNA interferase RelE/StbE
MKQIAYKPAAQKALRKMPRNEANRIMAKIELYATNPAAMQNNVTALQGRDGLRLRVGNWRVIMKDGEVLDILDIGARGSIYQ